MNTYGIRLRILIIKLGKQVGQQVLGSIDL